MHFNHISQTPMCISHMEWCSKDAEVINLSIGFQFTKSLQSFPNRNMPSGCDINCHHIAQDKQNFYLDKQIFSATHPTSNLISWQICYFVYNTCNFKWQSSQSVNWTSKKCVLLVQDTSAQNTVCLTVPGSNIDGCPVAQGKLNIHPIIRAS